MQVQIFKCAAVLASKYEATVATQMHAHEKGCGHKGKMPKSEPHGGGRPVPPRERVEFRVLSLCATGEQTPAGSAPDDLSKGKWSVTFSGLHRKKYLDRRPITRTGAKYLYTITQKGRDALDAWGDV